MNAFARLQMHLQDRECIYKITNAFARSQMHMQDRKCICYFCVRSFLQASEMLNEAKKKKIIPLMLYFEKLYFRRTMVLPSVLFSYFSFFLCGNIYFLVFPRRHTTYNLFGMQNNIPSKQGCIHGICRS